MTRVVAVGRLRIGIVHGDAESLAGWRFAHDALDDSAAGAWLAAVRAASRIDVVASSHACLPALREFTLDAGRLTIINNGAAGMPNFRGAAPGRAFALDVVQVATEETCQRDLAAATKRRIRVPAT
jgi:hypothetical protein